MEIPADAPRVTIYCSCGEALRGFLVETETAYETRILHGADHINAGHTVWVRGNPVNLETLRILAGEPTSKMSAPTYQDPR